MMNNKVVTWVDPSVVLDRLHLSESPETTSKTTSKGIEMSLFTNKDYCLKNDKHSVNALGNIQRMRQHGQLCDVILKIGTEKFSAHKVVLASVSPYFFAMFNGEMREQSQSEITMVDMDAIAVDLLLDYAYTGQITITVDNVQILLPASSLLQMEDVREACCTFLLKRLHPSNCLGIRSFADTHSCKDLHHQSHVYVLQNFPQVIATEEFLSLPFEEVNELVSNSELNIFSEEDVFTAVLNWVKHDLIEREKYISKLFNHVRLPLLTREFLMTRVDTEKLIRDNHECQKLLFEAMRYHLAPERRCEFSSSRTMERKPLGADPYVFAIGGLSKSGFQSRILSECEVYNPKTNCWNRIAPMQSRRSCPGVTSLKHRLYVIGGHDGASQLATAECYNPWTNTWTSITSMRTKRYGLGTCSFDGLIYACGGNDGVSSLSSMESFDPLTGIWNSCPDMKFQKDYCKIAVLDSSLYAIGGGNKVGERYDPREGKWDSVPSMSTSRYRCGVAALDGNLYCLGGLNRDDVLLSYGERLNLRMMSWEPVTPMHTARYWHELVSLNGRLLAVGGFNNRHESLNSVEEYDIKTNKWTLVTSMLSKKGALGGAVLDFVNLEHFLGQTSA